MSRVCMPLPIGWSELIWQTGDQPVWRLVFMLVPYSFYSSIFTRADFFLTRCKADILCLRFPDWELSFGPNDLGSNPPVYDLFLGFPLKPFLEWHFGTVNAVLGLATKYWNPLLGRDLLRVSPYREGQTHSPHPHLLWRLQTQSSGKYLA